MLHRHQIKTAWVTINRSKIFYQEIGEGYPLVFLHGGGASLESFAGQIPFFSKNHHVIAIDTRGHGRSSRGRKPLTYDTMVDDTIAVLNELDIARADFIGWSDGGNTSLLLALSHPDRVRRLTLISANYHPEGIDDDISVSGNIFLRSLYRWFSPHPEKWQRLSQELNDLWQHYPQLGVNDLTDVSAKTLIIAGEGDLVSIKHLEEMKYFIPKATLHIIPDGKHDVHLTHSALVNALITEHSKNLASDYK